MKIEKRERNKEKRLEKKKRKLSETEPPEDIEINGDLIGTGLPMSFGSTKGQKVEGNSIYSVKIKSSRAYRQYMNRKGGFNRNLDPDNHTGASTSNSKHEN